MPANHTQAVDYTTKGTTQYHTHWAKGNPRNHTLHAYKNASTHDDFGHKHHTGPIISHDIPQAKDTHWPGGKKPYNLGPLPATYSFRTHFPGGRPREPNKYLDPSVVYDPNWKQKTNLQPQQHHVAHDHTQEIHKLKAEIRNLTGQVAHYKNLHDQQVSAHDNTKKRHTNTLAQLKSRATTQPSFVTSRPSGVYKHPGRGRGGRGD